MHFGKMRIYIQHSCNVILAIFMYLVFHVLKKFKEEK